MAIDLSTNANQIITLFGSSATLKRKTDSVDKYGDNSPTYTSETITVGINDVDTNDKDWTKYGVLITADKLFFIKSSVTAPNEGDQIVYRSATYEIVRIRTVDSGYISHYECWANIV
jgi:hypothetical protein